VIYYPTVFDVASIAKRIAAPVRDLGLIESALARPRMSVLGEDAYPDLWTKAAALLHSFVSNHPFVDGNKRMGWIMAVTFLRANGAVTSLDIDQDRAYDLVMSIASGNVADVDRITDGLRSLFDS
jgi:death-on-curing protein